MVNDNIQDQVPPLPTKSPVLNHVAEFEGGASRRPRRPLSMSILIPLPTIPQCVYEGHHTSLQFMATMPLLALPFTLATPPQQIVKGDEEFGSKKINLKWSAKQAVGRCKKDARKAPNGIWGAIVSQTSQSNLASFATEPFSTPSLIATLHFIYPIIPAKHLLFFGLFACLLNSAMMPIFWFLVSHPWLCWILYHAPTCHFSYKWSTIVKIES